jgi:hypothetical protein
MRRNAPGDKLTGSFFLSPHASEVERAPSAQVALRSHRLKERGEVRLPARHAKPCFYAEIRMRRPPPHGHSKEWVDGSSPSQDFAKPLQISGFYVLDVA